MHVRKLVLIRYHWWYEVLTAECLNTLVQMLEHRQNCPCLTFEGVFMSPSAYPIQV